ncbi:MAG: TMEM175 family protein [Vulcanimicrobiaceae bacterium]
MGGVSAVASEHPAESTEHLVRRLESFSDIVIGFSLAEVTLSLHVPASLGSLLDDPRWLIAYLWTFAVVSQLWYMHHRLFVRAFFPTRLTVPLHFAWLASLGLIVFSLQVYVRFIDVPSSARAVTLAYFALYGVNLGLIAILYALGVHRLRAIEHGTARAHAARRTAIRIGIAAAVVLVLVALGPALHGQTFWFVVPPSIGYGFAVANSFMRFVWREPRPLSAT